MTREAGHPDQTLDGVLVIDKPAGPTSHDVVAHIRRTLRLTRVGHTGTLDPMATGVLPLVLGRATRLARFLFGGVKTYSATIRLGIATDTYDALGTPVAAPISTLPTVDTAALDLVLDRFRGTFDQSPPPFSAKKVGGTRAYALARRGRSVQPAPVSVTVTHLERLWIGEGRLALRVAATAGFYVRSLAHDLGAALGCGAHLEVLRRERSGQFLLAQANRLEEIERAPSVAATRLVPLARLDLGLPSVVLTNQGRRFALHGRTIPPGELVDPPAAPGPARTEVRLLDGRGKLVAVAETRDGALHPRVVLV